MKVIKEMIYIFIGLVIVILSLPAMIVKILYEICRIGWELGRQIMEAWHNWLE